MSTSEICARCSGLGWVTAENSFYPRSLSCSACNGTGKADCAPIKGEKEEWRCACGAVEAHPLTEDCTDVTPSPAKRDATEVHDYHGLCRENKKLVDDHAAAIARVEAENAGHLRALDIQHREIARINTQLALQAEEVGRMREALEEAIEGAECNLMAVGHADDSKARTETMAGLRDAILRWSAALKDA